MSNLRLNNIIYDSLKGMAFQQIMVKILTFITVVPKSRLIVTTSLDITAGHPLWLSVLSV